MDDGSTRIRSSGPAPPSENPRPDQPAADVDWRTRAGGAHLDHRYRASSADFPDVEAVDPLQLAVEALGKVIENDETRPYALGAPRSWDGKQPPPDEAWASPRQIAQATLKELQALLGPEA